jgi:sn-glycerol 3-phosphate transport system ATP-binding protein
MNLLKDAPNAQPGVITGIRPEHLDITPTGWALQVEAVEMLGAERLIYGKWAHKLHVTDADELLIIRTEESAAVPALGATLHVTPRPDRIHHFDAGTGKRMVG